MDDAQLIMAGEHIDREFNEEIDKARRDEGREREKKSGQTHLLLFNFLT